ncbi:MAG: sulfite reductase subunit alpha [Euryarchaeota archaeon]|nr:sulfite reductase subunit alpha [Euryarchaeota archaeon]|tara:strand:- start:180 stop:1289 length:1110 start_codon:yes stop_codon:yes gene_type:complete
MATVTNSYCISEGSNKETNHYVISLRGSGIRYKPGDSLGFYPINNLELVKHTIRKIKAKRKDIVETSEMGKVTLENALLNRFIINRAGKKFLVAVAEKLTNKKLKKELAEILDDKDKTEKYLFTRDYIDILDEYFVRFTPQEFIDNLAPISPRLYSISSSPKAHPGEVHLTVAIVKYNNFERDRYGLATGDLATRIEVNKTQIPVYISQTRDFILPENKSTDIIMVGPGTGIAPFRAFLEHRRATEASGKNWLFFGEVHEESTFFYKDEWFEYMQEGYLHKLTTAFSRDQDKKIYVQNRLLSNGKEIWKWLQNGAYFYICGDKQYMAKDVHKALISIAEEHGKMKKEDAENYINQTLMKEEHRYLRDVY